MKYKMLVLDLDDTLLTDDHTISNENAAMLSKAQELGVFYYSGLWKADTCHDRFC